LQHVEVPLPDRAGRAALWKLMLREKVPGRGDLDFERLADTSKGLSGGDIKNAVVISLSEAVRRKDQERKITMADLEHAIDVGKRAKRDIGEYVYEETVERQEVDDVSR
jgi:ATP-dependent 26S proteasome regulatory subunit